MRAVGYAVENNGMLNGTVRFEAVIPNQSFQVVQVKSIAVLKTPLSTALTDLRDGHYSGSSFGYLTMNQTRRLVPILETDSAVSLCPLIGIWISMHHEFANEQSNQSRKNMPNALRYLQHPKVWGGCVRFCNHDKICERVLMNQQTFLLVRKFATVLCYLAMALIMIGIGRL